jgi:hypothetical protein
MPLAVATANGTAGVANETLRYIHSTHLGVPVGTFSSTGTASPLPRRRNSVRFRENWLGRKDSNLRMAVPKTAALPLGYAPARAIAGAYMRTRCR